jgi:hypothetical protein
MNPLALAAALFAPAFQPPGGGDRPAWQDGTSEAGGYTVQFPASPKQERVNFPTPDGVAKMVRQYAILPLKANCAVAHVDLPAAYVKRLTPRGVIKDIRDGMIRPFGAKVGAEKEITLGMHPGVEFTAAVQLKGVDLTASGRIYVVGNRAYTFLVMARKDSGFGAEDVGKFFQSFRLLSPSDWKEHVWKDARCSILLPGEPQQTTVKGPDGETIRVCVLPRGDTTYAMAFIEVPEAQKEGPDAIRARFDSARDNAVAKRKGKVIREQELKLDGNPGREYRCEMPDGTVFRNRMFLVGGRFYQVVVTGPREVALGQQSDRFLDSFKLTK